MIRLVPWWCLLAPWWRNGPFMIEQFPSFLQYRQLHNRAGVPCEQHFHFSLPREVFYPLWAIVKTRNNLHSIIGCNVFDLIHNDESVRSTPPNCPDLRPGHYCGGWRQLVITRQLTTLHQDIPDSVHFLILTHQMAPQHELSRFGSQNLLVSSL